MDPTPITPQQPMPGRRQVDNFMRPQVGQRPALAPMQRGQYGIPARPMASQRPVQPQVQTSAPVMADMVNRPAPPQSVPVQVPVTTAPPLAQPPPAPMQTSAPVSAPVPQAQQATTIPVTFAQTPANSAPAQAPVQPIQQSPAAQPLTPPQPQVSQLPAQPSVQPAPVQPVTNVPINPDTQPVQQPEALQNSEPIPQKEKRSGKLKYVLAGGALATAAIVAGAVFGVSYFFQSSGKLQGDVSVLAPVPQVKSATTTTANTNEVSSRDTERKNELIALQTVIEAYYNQAKKYPTLANLNDLAFRAAMPGGQAITATATTTDPISSSYILSAVPGEGLYAYEVLPKECDNQFSSCSSYKLTATLESGQVYTRDSLTK